MKGNFRAGGWVSFACLAAGLASLCAGLFRIYFFQALSFSLGALILWAAGRRLGWTWTPGLFLAVCAAAAAGGLLSGAAPAWMLACLTLALAAFELWDADAGGKTELQAVFERRRGVLLAAALLAGLAAALFAGLLDFHVPFGGLGLAALVVLFGLYRLNELFKM